MSHLPRHHTSFYRAFWGLAIFIFFSSMGSENLFAQAITTQISGGATTISPGQVVCYDVAFAAPDKGANHNYTNITIVDVLDPRLEYVSSTGADNFNNGVVSGNTVTWTAPTLDDGTTGSFQICVKLKNGVAANGDIIPNKTTFNESGTTTATSASPTVTVNGILPNKIELAKKITSGGGNVVIGEQVTYEVKACNTGGVINNNFSMTDNLPSGAVVVDADGGTVTGSTITWTDQYGNTNLAPDDCWIKFVKVRFPSPAFANADPTSKFKNTLDASGKLGNGPVVNYPQVSTQPIGIVQPNFTFKNWKDGSDNMSIGYIGYFRMNFENNGNAAVKNLVITDPIPPQVNVTQIKGLFVNGVQAARLKYKINGQPTVYTVPPAVITDKDVFFLVSSFLSNTTDYISELIWEYVPDIQPGDGSYSSIFPRAEYFYTVLPNTHPYTVSGGTEVPGASVPVVNPSSFTNTAQYTSSNLPKIRDASVTTNIRDKVPAPSIDKFLSKVGGSYDNGVGQYFDISKTDNVSPSDTVEYVLRVTNTNAATDFLKKFTLSDALPAGVTYVPNSWQAIGASLVSTTAGTYNGVYPTSGAQKPSAYAGYCNENFMVNYQYRPDNDGCQVQSINGMPSIMPQPTFIQSGQNLSWSWDWDAWYNNYSGPNPAIALYAGSDYQSAIFIKFKAVVKPTVTTGATINNIFTLTSPQIPSANPIISDTTKQKILRKASLDSKKFIQGSLDNSFSSAGTTTQGGMSEYCIRIFNDGNVPMKNIEVIDVLPYANDSKILNDVPRVNPGSSQWRPVLNAPIVPPTGVTVMYSTAQKPCTAAITSTNANPMINLPGCNNPNFTSTPPADLSTVQTLVFDFGSMVLNPGDSVKLCWKMKTPADALVNQLAWNSFAYVADYADGGSGGGLLPSEPPPVSLILMKPVTCTTPSAPTLSVTNNVCPTTTGTINETTACGAGTRIEYSTDNGSTWSATAPTYGSAPITVIARCVTDADATCFSPNSAAVTTAPVLCPPPPPAAPCSITITQQTQSACNNNGTIRRAGDDYFTVSINATAISGGAQYEVVNLANTDGTGGNPLGFAAYGTAVTVGSSGNLIANNTAFTLTIRDVSNNACFKTITLNPVPPCSSNVTAPPNGPCGAVPCAPIKAVKNGQN